MRVAFIGGLDRLEAALEQTGAAAGVEVEVHRGDVHGRGAAGLANVIGRADHVVVVTGTNSHGGVQMAKKLARKSGARVWIVRACGLAIAKQIVEDVARRSRSGGALAPLPPTPSTARSPRRRAFARIARFRDGLRLASGGSAPEPPQP